MTNCDIKAPMPSPDDEFPLCSLYINPTRFCNLACRHCWVSPPRKASLGGGDGEMSIREMIEIIKEGVKLGVSSIKLTGGEPLLRKDIVELIEFCSGDGIGVDIETNGTLITEGTARLLKDKRVAHIAVSLDSPFEEKNDAFRGIKGAFRGAVHGIMSLIDEGLSPQVIISLYRDNLRDIAYFLDLMGKLGVRDVKINPIVPLGRGSALWDEGAVPGVGEVLEFSKKLEVLETFFDGMIYLDLPMAFRPLDKLKAGMCGLCAIKSILGILSDGSVSICGIGYLDKGLLFGNARNDPSVLGKIWREHPVLKSIREDIPAKLEGVCGICVFRNRCLGSCRADVYHNTGSLTAPYWFCRMAYEEGLFPSTRLIPEEIRA